MSHQLHPRVKAKIRERDGNKCVFCRALYPLTVDHIIPKSQGGTNEQSNLQTLCLRCNRRKGSNIEFRLKNGFRRKEGRA